MPVPPPEPEGGGGLSADYIAALGQFTPTGYSGTPTLYPVGQGAWDEGGFVQWSAGSAYSALFLGTLDGSKTNAAVGVSDFGQRTSTYDFYAESDSGDEWVDAFIRSRIDAATGLGRDGCLDIQTDLGSHIAIEADDDGSHVVVKASGRPEQQHVAQTGGATGGDFTLSTTIGPIGFDDDNATIQGVFDGALGPDVVEISGDADSAADFYVVWVSAGDQPLLTLTDNSLTGGTSPDVEITVYVAGADGQTDPLLDLQDPDANSIVRVTGDNKIGFYNHAAVALQAGVAVSDAAIHAALVNLGLITA